MRLNSFFSLLGTIHIRRKLYYFIQLLVPLIVSVIFGIFWYLLLYGRSPLYFSNVDWIYVNGGDVFQHQIGWEWFRQERWHFPLGTINDYGYPFGTSVSFMDSIPLFAIPFKILSPWLGENFQYLGLWELISIIVQIFGGMLILGEFSTSYSVRILGASLLVLSPPMIFRAFEHNSLSAHWILLLAIWFIIRQYHNRLWRGAWIILFGLATLIHIYFIVMLLPLWAIGEFFRISKGRHKWMVVVDIVSVLIVIFIFGYCTGAFSLNYGDLVAKGGYGEYSWNLNGFINPLSATSILNQLPLGKAGQREGFSYLGLGILFTLPIALSLVLQKEYSHRQLFPLVPFGVVILLYCLFALSNRAFVNTQPLWNITLPEIILKFCSMFRSSGRFIWPVYYFVVLFCVIGLIQNLKNATPFLIFVLVLQLIDVQQLFTSKKFHGDLIYQNGLVSEFWQSAAKTNKHVVLIPANYDAKSIYEPIALYARKNKMTLNWGYFARGNYGAIENYAESIWDNLRVGQPDNQTIYIFWGDKWKELALKLLSGHMVICDIDTISVAMSLKNDLVANQPGILHSCSFP